MVNHRITTKSALFILVSLIGTTATANSAMAQAEIFSNKENLSVGVTSLMSAVVDNDIDGVKFFLKSSDSINQKNLGGATALHIAARTQNEEIARILLENGADVNAVDAEGWTPLMRASLSKSGEIVNLLLLKGAKIEALNNFKDSAIVHAAMSDCNECLDYMVTKSNFVKTADLKNIKTQISRSFVITKNHDNQIGQDILTSGLDAAIRFAAAPSEDTVAINSYKETVAKGLNEPVEIVDLSYDKNKDANINAEQKPVAAEINQEQVFEKVEQKKIVELEQKLDDKSDVEILTEKDIPPVVIAKIEYKEAVAPIKVKGAKKFRLNQGPSIVKPEIVVQEPPVFVAEESEKEEIQPLSTTIEEQKESMFSAFLNIFRKKEKVVANVESEPSNVVVAQNPEAESKEEMQPLIIEEPKNVVVKQSTDSKPVKKFKFVQGPKGEVELADTSISNTPVEEAKEKVKEASEIKPDENVTVDKKEERPEFFRFLNFFSKAKNEDAVKETPKQEVNPEKEAASKEVFEKQTQPEINDIQIASEEPKKSEFFSFLNFFSKKKEAPVQEVQNSDFSKAKNEDAVKETPKEEVNPEKEAASKEVFEKQTQPEINDIQIASEEPKKSEFFSFLNFFSKKKEAPVQEVQNSEPKTPKKFKLAVGKR